jgi:hypothetical protein
MSYHFQELFSLHSRTPILRFVWGTGILYLKFRKILNGHCVKMKQKITTIFTKTLYTLCSKFTLTDVFPQSILYFYIYCMGQEKYT